MRLSVCVRVCQCVYFVRDDMCVGVSACTSLDSDVRVGACVCEFVSLRVGDIYRACVFIGGDRETAGEGTWRRTLGRLVSPGMESRGWPRTGNAGGMLWMAYAPSGRIGISK